MHAAITSLLMAVLLTTALAAPECPRATYCLAIDAGESFSDSDFTHFKTGFTALVRELVRNAPASQFLAHAFVQTAFPLVDKPTTNVAEIEKALHEYARSPGQSVMQAGLTACGTSLKNAPGPTFVLLLSKGGEPAPYTGVPAADALRLSGHSVVTISVDRSASDESLTGIADNPRYELSLNSVTEMVAEIADVTAFLCATLPKPRGLCSHDCPASTVCFAVDESGSISRRDFRMQAYTLAGLVSVLRALAPASLYAGVGFADEAHVFHPLTFDASRVMAAFLGNEQRKGSTSSGAGLLRCHELIKHIPGPKSIVLIADGVDNKQPRGVDIAQNIKDAGVQIITVGVGENLEHDLRIMAGPAEGDDYYTAVDNFPVFSQAIGPIVRHICTASSNWTPPPPPPSCAPVYCATCGQQLECFVKSGNQATDRRACAAVTDAHAMCARRHGHRTKCQQDCHGETPVVCYAGREFGTFAEHSACVAKHPDGSKLFPSFFAKYEGCQFANLLTKTKCLVKKCNADTLGQVCYPEHL